MGRGKWYAAAFIVGVVAAGTVAMWVNGRRGEADDRASRRLRMRPLYNNVALARPGERGRTEREEPGSPLPVKRARGVSSETEVYEVRSPGAADVTILRSPDGAVTAYATEGVTVSAFRTPRAWGGVELSPGALALTDFSSVGGGVTVGVFRAGSLHVGPAASYDTKRRATVGAALTCELWQNVGVGVYGGKVVGREGWVGGAVIHIAVKR